MLFDLIAHEVFLPFFLSSFLFLLHPGTREYATLPLILQGLEKSFPVGSFEIRIFMRKRLFPVLRHPPFPISEQTILFGSMFPRFFVFLQCLFLLPSLVSRSFPGPAGKKRSRKRFRRSRLPGKNKSFGWIDDFRPAQNIIRSTMAKTMTKMATVSTIPSTIS